MLSFSVIRESSNRSRLLYDATSIGEVTSQDSAHMNETADRIRHHVTIFTQSEFDQQISSARSVDSFDVTL